MKRVLEKTKDFSVVYKISSYELRVSAYNANSGAFLIIIFKDENDVFVKEFNKVSKNMYIKERLFSSFHVLALFKTEVSLDHEKELIDKLNLIGVTTLSLSKCYIGDPLKKGLILGYSSVQISVMRNKLKLMAKYI